jgi:hypothetical protein
VTSDFLIRTGQPEWFGMRWMYASRGWKSMCKQKCCGAW